MTKRAEVIFGLLLILTALAYIFLCAIPAHSQESYIVPNFAGGIFVTGDSSDILPNQALSMVNVSLDVDGSIVGRWGYSVIDSVSPDTTKEIQKLFIYQPQSGTQRLVFVQDGYIYVFDSLKVPKSVTWSNYRLKYTGGNITIATGNANVYDVAKDNWYYITTGVGDQVKFANDSLRTVVSLSDSFDYKMSLTPGLFGTGTTTYTVYKKLNKPSWVGGFNKKLYLCDSLDRNGETWVYDDNDKSIKNIIAVDTGLVSKAPALNDTLWGYNAGLARIFRNTNKAYASNDSIKWQTSNGVTPGRIFIYDYRKPPDYTTRHQFITTITAVDSARRVLTLNDAFTDLAADSWNGYKIAAYLDNCSLDSGLAITDKYKNWNDVSFGDFYLKTFYAVLGDSGLNDGKIAYCNTDTTFSVSRREALRLGKSSTLYWHPDSSGTSFLNGNRYYILSRYPNAVTNFESTVNFHQLLFFDNSLFGFGTSGTMPLRYFGNHTTYNNRVFYSEPYLPYYMPYNYNFDLDANEKVTALFEIQNSLFIASDRAIWRMGGSPSLRSGGGDMSLSKAVTGLGIKNFDQVTVAGNDYAYFLSYGDIYKFNGYRAEKISFPIEPILAKYANAKSLLWYMDHKLFVSFPDSSVTIVYDEERNYPNGAFYTWDFGVNAVYVMPDSNIFYFATPQHKGHIFYWPNGLYYDHFPTYNYRYSIEYSTGWQSFGKPSLMKYLITQGSEVPLLAPDTMYLDVYVDFEDTVRQTLTCRQPYRYVYIPAFNNKCVGEYFKFIFRTEPLAVAASPLARINLKGYRLTWNGWDSRQKSQ